MGQLLKFSPRRSRRKRKPPADFDPVADVLSLMGPGRHLASEIAAELADLCAIYGVKPPSSIQLGKRLAQLATVSRERVYAFASNLGAISLAS